MSKRIGSSIEKIYQEMAIRTRLLQKLSSEKMLNYKEFSKMINNYYKDPEFVLKEYKVEIHRANVTPIKKNNSGLIINDDAKEIIKKRDQIIPEKQISKEVEVKKQKNKVGNSSNKKLNLDKKSKSVAKKSSKSLKKSKKIAKK